MEWRRQARATGVRERVRFVWMWLEGMSLRAIARHTGASVTTVYRWIRRWQREGHVNTRARRNNTQVHTEVDFKDSVEEHEHIFNRNTPQTSLYNSDQMPTDGYNSNFKEGNIFPAALCEQHTQAPCKQWHLDGRRHIYSNGQPCITSMNNFRTYLLKSPHLYTVAESNGDIHNNFRAHMTYCSSHISSYNDYLSILTRLHRLSGLQSTDH